MEYGIAPDGYRLPTATRLGRVRLQIADLERSIAYYETVLGLRVIDRANGVARLGAQGDDRVIVELHEKRACPSRDTSASIIRRAAAGSRRSADSCGIRRDRRVRRHVGSFRGEAVTSIPTDSASRYADRPRDQWRVQERQLAMTTVPLDAESRSGRGRYRGPARRRHGARPRASLRPRFADAERSITRRRLRQSRGAIRRALLVRGGYHHLGTNTWPRARVADRR